MVPPPYSFAYTYVHRKRKADIERALLHEPQLFRRIAWASRISADSLPPKTGWSALRDYADAVEAKMAALLSSHSVYYWLFLYRRLGVELHSRHENKTDANTLALVRWTVESAIQKYGRLDLVDVLPAGSAPVKEWFGGVLYEAFVALVGQQEAMDALERLCARSSDTVPVGFSEETLIDLYRVEGYAYEYWLTTAHMRSIGKGGVLYVREGGPVVDGSEELEGLIESYDRRIEESGPPSSSIGVAFPGDPKDNFVALVPVYNVRNEPPLFPPGDPPFALAEGVSTNFIVRPLQIGAFLDAHQFAAQAFRKVRGFALGSLCAVLAATTWRDFHIRTSTGKLSTGHAFNLWQRGYALAGRKAFEEGLAQWAVELMKHWRPSEATSVEADAKPVLEYLTLSPARQELISLWTHGPLCPFVPHGDQVVADLAAVGLRLRKEFFGIRQYRQDAKGPLFEEAFRRLVAKASLHLFDERILRSQDGEEREVDAAVRVGATLVLCECRAMERPLNFERGDLDTIKVRSEDLQKKVDQALSLADFVRSHPTGRNYDFSWAREIVPLVVSPFVEWIWSRDRSLWVTPDLPRVVSAGEAIEFLKGLRTVPVPAA
jgi:hypothetical protein